jgi:molecular chaperone DnaK (HSP70)
VRLGIDFGTTRTVVAACDRGNYPVISFNTRSGDSQEFFPSVIAEKAGQLCFGFEALARRGEPGWALCFSFKRWLSAPDATPGRRVRIGSLEMDLVSLVSRYLEALRTALLTDSNLPRKGTRETLEATVAVPANSFSTQRLVTLEAFRNAGFRVLSMLNEPSAAGVEYAHRYRNTLNSRREKVLVYDLGGGTFDVSLVDMQGQAHDVLASRGLGRLGGDDFDDVLLDLALKQAGVRRGDLSASTLVELGQHCRELKESINPNTRKIHVELERYASPAERKQLKLTEGKGVVVAMDAYDAACTPLLDRTLELVRQTLAVAPDVSPGDSSEAASNDDGEESSVHGIAGLYVVGGASALPAVARGLRTAYGRRVKRSPYPSGAIAIGLAIAADEAAAFELTQRYQHNLGVFREVHGGMQIGFDRIIGPETLVPVPGGEPVRLSRRYRATHNVGHFRFIECGWLDDSGGPSGDIKPFADVRFPFDPTLRTQSDLSHVPVARTPVEGPEIEERYMISEFGTVELTILDRESGFERHYKIAG